MPRKTTHSIPLTVQRFDELPDSALVDIRTVALIKGVSVATAWRWVGKGILAKPEPKAQGTNSTRWKVGKLRESVRTEPVAA